MFLELIETWFFFVLISLLDLVYDPEYISTVFTYTYLGCYLDFCTIEYNEEVFLLCQNHPIIFRGARFTVTAFNFQAVRKDFLGCLSKMRAVNCGS